MSLVITPFTFLEIAIFLLAILAFVMAVRFFMESQKRLKKLLPASRRKKKRPRVGFDRNGFLVPKSTEQKSDSSIVSTLYPTAGSKDVKEELKALRSMVLQQQQELTQVLQKISQSPQKNDVKHEEPISSPALETQKTVEQLQLQLEKKEAEIKKLKQQEVLSQKLQERFAEVESEFERLQEKMLKMEQQAWQAAELSIQLKHTEQSQLQLEKALLKKEETLRELSGENHRLQNALGEVEYKLSEANLQRQQLMKKVQFLEEMNADIEKMAEVNRKFKNEINRVAELESMLNLMTEERNALLKDK